MSKEREQYTKIEECRHCVHRRPCAGTHHISCANPDPAMKGRPHGIAKGWFWYPSRFDPVWKENLCNNFEEKGDDSRTCCECLNESMERFDDLWRCRDCGNERLLTEEEE